jgi:hypothetical protein
MAIELQEFASGDTDYIAKLNANVAALTEAIDGLQVQIGSVGGGSAVSAGMFLDAIFNRADALIGPTSYVPTKSATTLTVAPGGMYLAQSQTVVTSFSNVPLSFVGQPAGTHYIVVQSTGQPVRIETLQPGAIYSVYWSGSSLGTVTYIAPIFYDTREANASRKSTVWARDFPDLDSRFELVEATAKEAEKDANTALSIAYDLEASMGGATLRKVGCTVDGMTGLKGAIQIDFDGIIIGWSIIADVTGNIQIDVDLHSSPSPPYPPSIPNTTTDKISANAPIKLTGAQSASSTEAGVSTWITSVLKWDVIQFNTISVSSVQRATLYLLIQQVFPSPPVINPLSPVEEVW